MYEMVKIAGLSAALAGALMVAAGGHEPRSAAGKILTDRLESAAPAMAATGLANQGIDCTGAWPYRACGAAAARTKVRVIATDARGSANPIR